EWYTGYFTKYGDGGVAIQRRMDLTKGEVKDLAKHLGVTKDIIDKVASADLWEGQTDEIERGTSYDMIDAYLKEERMPKKDKQLIENMDEKTNHKRHIVKQYRFKK